MYSGTEENTNYPKKTEEKHEKESIIFSILYFETAGFPNTVVTVYWVTYLEKEPIILLKTVISCGDNFRNIYDYRNTLQRSNITICSVSNTFSVGYIL